MRYIRNFLCVSSDLHKDLGSYIGWEVHRGSGGSSYAKSGLGVPGGLGARAGGRVGGASPFSMKLAAAAAGCR